MVRSAFWLALLVVFAPCAAQLLTDPLSGERLVFSTAGLASSLMDPNVDVISLGQASITLESDAWTTYARGSTAVIESGRIVIIRSGIPGPVVLDFGGLPYAIYLQTGSLLSFERVNLTGNANPALYMNTTSTSPYAKYRISGIGLWPSISAEPGSQLSLVDSTIVFFNPYSALINCTQLNEKLVFALSKTFPGVDGSLVGDNGFLLPGRGILPVNVSLAEDSPGAGCRSTRERLAGSQLADCAVAGQFLLVYSNLSGVCLDSHHPGQASPGTNLALGLGVGFGVGIPLLIAAIVLALLMVRRRKRTSQLGLLPVVIQKHSTSEEFKLVPALESLYPVSPFHAGGRSTVPFASEEGGRSSGDSALRSVSGGSATRAGDVAMKGLESSRMNRLESTRTASGERYASLPEVLRTRQGGSLEGVEIGPLLGRGSFGRVYKGRWKGSTVAIKVLQHALNIQESITRESLLSTSIAHPSVVITYRIATVCLSSTEQAEEAGCVRKPQQFGKDSGQASGGVQPDGGGGGIAAASAAWESAENVPGSGGGGGGGGRDATGAAARSRDSQGSRAGTSSGSSGREVPAMAAVADLLGPDGKPFREEVADDSSDGEADAQEELMETWMLLEYCDRGALSRAVERGKLKSRSGDGGPDLMRVLMCLLDVASGMAYLHSMGILHGDLKSANVLLKSTATDLRGYHCKIADFGMSRMLGENKTHLSTNTYGTISYMAPELLTEGKLGKPADVYSFGILMWELYTAESLYRDMAVGQVLYAVAHAGQRPQVPEGCPPQYAEIMKECWHPDPAQRPDFETTIQMLQPLLAEARIVRSRASSSTLSSMGRIPSPDSPGGGIPLMRGPVVSPFSRMLEADALEPPSTAAALAAAATAAFSDAMWPAAAVVFPGMAAGPTSPFAEQSQQQLPTESSAEFDADALQVQISARDSNAVPLNRAEIESAGGGVPKGQIRAPGGSPGSAGIAGRRLSERLQDAAIEEVSHE